MYLNIKPPRARKGEPAWQTALLFPPQGEWTEEDFFGIEGSDNRLKELVDGYLEILPMPTAKHQIILIFLFDALRAYLRGINDLGTVLLAPLPVHILPGKIREPDLIYLDEDRSQRMSNYPDGADLVMEIVSGTDEDRRRDLVTKRKEYARAGIREYWIVDPQSNEVTVLALNRKAKSYREHGIFPAGAIATSKMFAGFQINVAELFRAARPR